MMKQSITRPCLHWTAKYGCERGHCPPVDCHATDRCCYEANFQPNSAVVRDWRIQILGLNATDAAIDPNICHLRGKYAARY